MRIAVVGAGVVGTALAVRWREAGHELTAVSGRSDATRDRASRYLPGVPFEGMLDTARSASVVVLGVPDDAIQRVCQELVTEGGVGAGDRVVHLSGAAQLDVLASAADLHAEVFSLHPLQTFPTVDAALDRLPGSQVAVTADGEHAAAIARTLAADTGAEPFDLPDAAKPLYHASAVMASNAVVAILGAAHELMRDAGIEPHVLAPLERASFENALALGPEAALTGPAARGDASTIARNIDAVANASPDLVPLYLAITDEALRLAGDRLTAQERDAVEAVLKEWR